MARFFLLILLIFAFPARAEDYAPGTVGHLYENCRLALEGATKYTELQETYCGAFSEGYFWGAVKSNWIFPVKVHEGPCAADEKREWERINSRFCPNYPKLMYEEKVTTGDALKTATDTVTRWIEFEREQGEGDPLKRGLLREISGLVQPGPFCDSLKESKPVESAFTINPSLMKMNFTDFMKATSSMTMRAKFDRCKSDVDHAAGNPEKFLSTKCGAEISGYISGLHLTQHLQKNRAEVSPECKKPIDRLYKNFDVTQSMCVSYDTNPLRVAEIFLSKYPEFKGIENQTGSIGDLIIYRGFLCADKAANP